MDSIIASSTITFAMNQWIPILDLNVREITEVGRTIPIPQFCEEDVSGILEYTLYEFKRNTPVIHLCEPIYIFGDLHGNLHDFLRIFASIPESFSQKFLLLGDYVDRGPFQTELMLLLLLLKIQYPLNFFLLRGNHEFVQTNSQSGFHAKVCSNYSQRIYTLFNEVFNYLPLAALINHKVLCVHGGIGPNFKTIDQIEKIEFPLQTYDNDKCIQELLWSDPDYTFQNYAPNVRGIGVMYGKAVLSTFLHSNHLTRLIRGHESIVTGIQSDEDCLVYTVFSSSGYCNMNCLGGFLLLDGNVQPKGYTYESFPVVSREEALFFTPYVQKTKMMKKISGFRSLSNLLVGTPGSRKRYKNYQNGKTSTSGSSLSSSDSCNVISMLS